MAIGNPEVKDGLSDHLTLGRLASAFHGTDALRPCQPDTATVPSPGDRELYDVDN